MGKAGASRGSGRVASGPCQACRPPLGLVWGASDSSQGWKHGIWGPSCSASCRQDETLGKSLRLHSPLGTPDPRRAFSKPAASQRRAQNSSGQCESLGSVKIPVRFSFPCPFILQRFWPHPQASALSLQPWGPEPLTSVQPTILRNHLLVGRVPASLLGRAGWAKEGMGSGSEGRERTGCRHRSKLFNPVTFLPHAPAT